MTINWAKYKAPYKEAITELPEQLDYLFTTTLSSEDVGSFLYTEVAPNIKHQYRIFNIILPVIEYLDILLKGNKNALKIEILDFLGYIFAEFIRDENNLMITPIKYQACSLKLKDEYPEEYSYYLKFKDFVKKNYIINQQSKDTVAFYGAALFDREPITSQLNQIVRTSESINKINVALFGLGLLRFKNTTKKIKNLLFSWERTGDKHTNVASALNGMYFNEKELKNSLKSKNLNQEILWGNGYEAVLATSAYLMCGQEQKNEKQKEIIDRILINYKKHLDDYQDIDEFEIDFPLHKFMLEDASCVLFKDHLGSGKIYTVEEMNEVQKYFFKRLSREYKVHTYALLHAGVLPIGMDINTANNCEDIYSCYE